MKPTCETASESTAQPQSDAGSGRISHSESIKDYAYVKTDYEHSSNNDSITNLDEQLRQLEEESRSLRRTLNEKIDNLEPRMKDNNIIIRQQAEIHP